MKSVKKSTLTIITAMALGMPPLLLAEETRSIVAESRYVSTQAGPTPAQTDLLQSIITVHIPEHLQTVGAALEYLLHPYGLRLINIDKAVPEQSLLLSLTLPEPHRTLGSIKLIDVLHLFGGEAFNLTINPVKRTVSYALKADYQHYVSEADINEAQHSWNKKKLLVAHYGPVKPDQSLSSIVTELGFKGLALEQRMVQIFQANVDAFSAGNMNALKKGVMLSIPSINSDVALSLTTASQLVDEHYRLWIANKVSHDE